MNPVSPWVTLALAVTLLVVGATGGWLVKGWKDGAAESVQAKTDLAGVVQASKDATAAQIAATNVLTAQNAKNAANIAAMSDKLGEQNSAIFKVQHDIDTLPLGGCTLTAAGNRVYADAYQAAFGASAAASGQTGVGHAKAKSAATAR